MSKKSTIKQHVQTSIVARIIYRIICIALICIGLIGLFFTYSTFDKYTAYTKRTQTTTATVTNVSRQTDQDYDYQMCGVSYKFKINDHEYTSDSSWETLPLGRNCQLSNNDKITVRYESTRPQNNAYGDNSLAREVNLYASIALVILSVAPLGVGFVGLVAIHKALKAENELETATVTHRSRITKSKTVSDSDDK